MRYLFRIEKQSVIVFEKRKMFRQDETVDVPIAKATYVLKGDCWKIYCQLSDLKWRLYEPAKQVKVFQSFIWLLEADQYHYFWG